MANDLKEYWTRRMAEQGRAVDGTPLPTQTPQTTQTPQAATTPQADTTPASNNPLYNYWSRRMAEQGKAVDGSPLTSNLTAAPGAEANTTNLRVTSDKWRTTVSGADAYLRNTGNDDFVYDDNVNRTQYNSVKSLLDDVLADQTLLRQQGRTIDADNLQYDIDRLQQKLGDVDEIYKAYHKETPEPAAQTARTREPLDLSIQKTLGSSADYSQQITDLESQLAELEDTNTWGKIGEDYNSQTGEAMDVEGWVNNADIRRVKEEIQNARASLAAAERAEKREALKGNADYAQNSAAATPLAENPEAQKLINQWINKRGNVLGGTSTDAVSGEEYTEQSTIDLLGYATEDENQMFNYILNTQGENAAREYIDDLRYDLNARQASAKSQEASQYADEHEVKASAKSVGQNLISGAGLLDTTIQNAYRDLTGNNRRIDYNTWANQQGQQVQATRGTVAQELTDKYGTANILGKEVSVGDLYQLGMSMADSGATALLGGATGLGSGTALLLGASAGSQATQEAVRNGATDSQAIMLGWAAAAAETITEKYSLESLISAPGKTLLANMARQAGVEASEEAASTILNTLADEAIRKEDSEYNRRIRELEAGGMSSIEANNQAWKEFGTQLLFDAIGGAISGGIMGGMAKSINGDTNTDTQQETRAPDNELLNTLSQYDNAQIQAINKSNQENAILRAMDEYDQRNAADVERNRNILSRLADYDASNIAAMKATEQINAKRAEAAQQRADAQNAEIRARNEQRRQTQALNNSKYQVADTYNYQLTPEEQMSLQYDSKSKFREALVAQSNGEISYKEAGEIFDSARNKGNRGSERLRLSEEAEALAWEATSPTQFIKQNKAFLRQNGIDYADARKIWQNVRNRAEYENAVQQNPALAEELEPEVEPSYTPINVRGADFSMPFSEITGTTTAQNSPTEQTSAVETNNVSTEPTLSATETQQTASAPTVSETQQNPYQERAKAIRQRIDEAQAQNTETQQQKAEPKARAERTPRQKPARRTPEARNIFNATGEEIKAKGFEPSQADNSMSGIAQMQGAEDHTQTMAKERISEEESVQRAVARVRADAKGEAERLLNKNAWTGVDIDAAAQIGAQLADEARQSGDWSAYDNFYQQCEQRHSEAGRALQALAKYVRDKGRQIAQKAADTIAKSKLSDARKKEVRAKIEDYAARYDEIRNGRVDYQRKNASNPQSDLKTTDDGSIVDGTQFEQTADNQRTSISDEDVQSLRDMIMEIAKERNTTYLGDKALNAANKILGKSEAVFNKILEKRLNKLGDTEADVDYMMRLLENQISRIATDNVKDIGGKIKSWQVRSMLLTLTSFERNMGGNESYGIFDVLAENFVGRATDDLLSKVTGKKTTVKQSRWLNEAYRKGALEAAERSMLEIALDADPSEGKYTGTGSALKHNSKNPVERFLANLDQILAYSLNSTDKLQRGGIESELSTGLTQIKNSNLSKAEIEKMAQRAADERLFQEDNTVTKTAQWVHDWLNAVLGAGGTLYDANGRETQSRSEAVRRRGGFGIGDAVSAFVKVPINIGMKAYQWSPLAYGESIKRIVDVIADARNGTLTAEQQRKAVMTAARSVTGTGLIYLAQLAAKAGLLKSFDDEDDWDKQSLESAEGKSGLQFNVSAMQRLLNGEDPAWDEKNDLVLSLGWLEPANAWMRMGYMLSQLDEDSNVVDKAFALGQGAVQSYLDMPLVSSLSDAINTFKYSTSDNIGSKLLEAGEAYVLSTISGFIPNIMKQIAKGTDTKYRSTDADTFGERFANTVKMGIPGKYGRESLAPKLDNYGREREYKGGSAYGNFANAALRPGTINRIDSEIVTAELDRLYEATGDKKIYPDRKPPKSLSYDGYDPVELNTEEKETYQKVYGDTVYQMHQELINSDEYKALTDDQKALVLDSINAYAKAAATSAIMDKWDSEYTGGEGEINWFAKYTNDWDDEAEHFKDDTAGLTRYIATEKAFKTDLKEGNFDAIKSLIENIDTHQDSNGNFTNPEMQYYADNIDGFEKYVLAMRAGVTPEMFAQAKDMYSYWNQGEWNSLSQEAKTNRLNGMFDDAYETADWSDKQKDTVKDLLKYYNMSPVNTQRYEKMGNYGVDSRTITAIESDIEALKASAGYEDLNDTQKKYRQYEAVLKRAATLSDDQALELVRSYGSLGPGGGAMKYMIQQYFGDKPESFQEELYNAYRDENKSSNGKTWGHNWGRTKPDNPFD